MKLRITLRILGVTNVSGLGWDYCDDTDGHVDDIAGS